MKMYTKHIKLTFYHLLEDLPEDTWSITVLIHLKMAIMFKPIYKVHLEIKTAIKTIPRCLVIFIPQN